MSNHRFVIKSGPDTTQFNLELRYSYVLYDTSETLALIESDCIEFYMLL
jgi:hypothetical protein